MLILFYNVPKYDGYQGAMVLSTLHFSPACYVLSWCKLFVPINENVITRQNLSESSKIYYTARGEVGQVSSVTNHLRLRYTLIEICCIKLIREALIKTYEISVRRVMMDTLYDQPCLTLVLMLTPPPLVFETYTLVNNKNSTLISMFL